MFLFMVPISSSSSHYWLLLLPLPLLWFCVCVSFLDQELLGDKSRRLGGGLNKNNRTVHTPKKRERERENCIFVSRNSPTTLPRALYVMSSLSTISITRMSTLFAWFIYIGFIIMVIIIFDVFLSLVAPQQSSSIPIWLFLFFSACFFSVGVHF